ncbi:MAG: AFG1 family ATPase [Rhodobacteraceae bacterium]|nr:AFG1 family ATPase [Paracoccaceae bacterium]
MGPPLTETYDRMVAAGRLVADPAQRAALAGLEARRLWLEAGAGRRRGLLAGFLRRPPEGPGGLYLWGGVGRGKSMLMDLFAEGVAIPERRRVHFHAFMQEVHAGMHAARRAGTDDALAPVADGLAAACRLLCLDELQITDITDAMVVGRLFERLLAAGVMVVATSNRPPEDLYRDGLNRASFLPFIALIRDRLEVRELATPTDWRRLKLAGAAVYFQPLGPAAKAAMDGLWDALTGGAAAAPLVLAVQGRRVELGAFAAGVVRAGFWDLCGRPLGAADYLALAAAARVVMIDDIPRLSAANYNEARRFVTLVDVLYEARTRLLAAAADRPERLYLEGEGSFEFARTASRLIEMQAADWGG